jgi:Lsr2
MSLWAKEPNRSGVAARSPVAGFAAARRAAGGTGRRPSTPAPQRVNNHEQIAAIRAWAKVNGHTVSDRGRISKVVLESYENRANTASPEPADAPAKKKSRKRSLTAAG